MNITGTLETMQHPDAEIFVRGSATEPTISATAHYDRIQGRYQLQRITHENPIGGLTLTQVRSTALHTHVVAALRETMLTANGEELGGHRRVINYLRGRSGRPMAEATVAKVRATELEQVYLIYRLAKICQDHPNVAVARVLGVSRSTAISLVRAARTAHENTREKDRT